MPDLELLRALAPPVEPASAAVVARARRLRKRTPAGGDRHPRRGRRGGAGDPGDPARRRAEVRRGGHPRGPGLAAAAGGRLAGHPRSTSGRRGTGEMTFAGARRHAGSALEPGRQRQQGSRARRRRDDRGCAGRRRPLRRLRTSTSPSGSRARPTSTPASTDTNLAAFRDVLDHVERVGAEDWLAALPENAIAPTAQAGDDRRRCSRASRSRPGFTAPSASADEPRDRYNSARWSPAPSSAAGSSASRRRPATGDQGTRRLPRLAVC